MSESALAELWDWAPVEANQEARRRNWGGNFTLEEREMGIQNVVTGLRRQLEDEDEEEEEMEVVGVRRRSGAGAGLEFDIAAPAPGSRQQQQQQQQKAAGPAVPLEDILRYMTTGIPPTQR